jgi:hypothetical protein
MYSLCIGYRGEKKKFHRERGAFQREKGAFPFYKRGVSRFIKGGFRNRTKHTLRSAWDCPNTVSGLAVRKLDRKTGAYKKLDQ